MAFVFSGSASQAARMSANSVSPPSGGMTRACSIEYLAGVALKLLSLCQSWLPRLNMRRRSSAASRVPSVSMFEMSFICWCLRRCLCASTVPRVCSSGPSASPKAIC